MRSLSRLLCSAVLLLNNLPGSSQSVIAKDTPANRAFVAWLSAFNSGDQAKAEAYVTTYDPTQTAAGIVAFHGQTGDLDFIRTVTQEPLLIRFEVKEHRGTTHAFGIMHVDGTSDKVTSFLLRALPPGAVPDDITLDAAERRSVIQGIGVQLNKFYIYADSAQQMAQSIIEREKEGEYQHLADGSLFAARLTADLRSVSHDKHLMVMYTPFKNESGTSGKSGPEQDRRFREGMLKANCGFENVEVLPGNVGYVKFNEFADAQLCGPTVASAMGFIAHTDAIIFDLRENHGGSPAMVSLIASYVFDQPTHLNDLYKRADDSTTQYWTDAYVPGERLGKVPVYVLISGATFSGAEEFAYDLKTQKRATIVGETTGGGAHPVDVMTIDDHFMIGVPVARPINPVTKKDWEGVGVEPDVTVKAADALAKAQDLARKKLTGR